MSLDKIFGLGQIPTVWLQENFLHAKAHWWDAAASIIYATHFIRGCRRTPRAT